MDQSPIATSDSCTQAVRRAQAPLLLKGIAHGLENNRNASPPPAPKPGLRGRIIANKKAELTEYMQNAVSLVKPYVPPDPAKLQATGATDVVTMSATMGQLNDGTIYTSNITLDAFAKNLKVTVQNSGYRKTN
jgi:hypothetical protein